MGPIAILSLFLTHSNDSNLCNCSWIPVCDESYSVRTLSYEWYIRICANVAYNNITLSLLKRFHAVIYNIIC